MRKRIAKLAFTLTLVLAGALFSVSTACAIELQQPNRYELRGDNFAASYFTSSLTGEARLTVKTAEGTQSFQGPEIQDVDSVQGKQVNVILSQTPDLETLFLTLFIPDINMVKSSMLLEASEGVMFEALVAFTRSRTTIAGPDLVQGVVQTYETQTVKGIASRVEFISPGPSWIMGEVTLSPSCPGPQRPGQVCERPFAGATVQLLDHLKMVVASAVTDKKGRFSFEAESGRYVVHVDTMFRLPACPDVPVTAIAGEKVFVSVQCDTGIR